MNRRFFFQAVGAVSLGVIVPPKMTLANVSDELQIIKLPDDPDRFVNGRYEISKGNRSKTCNMECGQDLIDCHGLCATKEWFDIIVAELEYDTKAWRIGDDGVVDCGPRLVVLTKSDKVKLLKFCIKMRGPHKCAYYNYEMSPL